MVARRPTVYYIRHGETDWNVAGRLQGRRDVPLNARGRAQAVHCGDILRDLFGLPSEGYRVEPQLAEIAFGDWEGFTIAQLHSRDPQRIAAREQDKWHFVPPGGESYKLVSGRMRDLYESLSRDTVAVAHGGTARGLMAHLGIAKPAAAPLVDIEQGVVYVFQADQIMRYA